MKKILKKSIFIMAMALSLSIFVSCSQSSSNVGKVDTFIKKAYVPEPEDSDVFSSPENQALGEGVDEDSNEKTELDKYLEDMFKPLMTETGYENFAGVNPLIWLGNAHSEEGLEITLKDLNINELKKEKTSDEFEYYEASYTIEYSKDDKTIGSQDLKSEIRMTKDGLVDDFRQSNPIQIP